MLPTHSTGLLGSSLATFLGGPVGKYAPVGRARWWTPLRGLIVLALAFLALGYLTKFNCLQGVPTDAGPQLNWNGERQYTSFCYNDFVPLYGVEGLEAGHFPYAYSWTEGSQTRYMEYPVLAGLFQWVGATITRAIFPAVNVLGFAIPEVSVYFTVIALLLSLAWLRTIVLLVRLVGGSRVWDVALVAASPVVIIHAFSNLDILPIWLTIAAFAQLKLHRPGRAGILLGLGTATKLWPVFILGALLTLAVKHRQLASWFKITATTIVAWLAVNLPFAFFFYDGWREFFRLNTTRVAEWTTLWALIPRETGWESLPVPVINTLSLVLFLALCAIIFWGGWRSPNPDLAGLSALIVIAFLLTNKVWSPQYSLWLVSLLALAYPRVKPLLIWGLLEMMVWPLLMWHMMGTAVAGPAWLLDLDILARDGMLVYLSWHIIGQFYRKQLPEKVVALMGPFAPVKGANSK